MTRVRESLGGKASRGSAWLVGQTLVVRSAQLASQIALAWFLVPSEFGAVGLALTVVAIAGALLGFGVSEVLVQRPSAVRLWAPHAMRLAIAAGTLAMLAADAAAPLAENIYATPGLTQLVLVAALTLPLEAFGSVPATLLRTEMRFGFLAMTGACETLAAQVLSLCMAYAGGGAYSLVVPMVLMAAARVSAQWNASRLGMPGRGGRRWPKLLGRSTAVLGTRMLTVLVNQGDYLVLGLISTQAAVGAYYLAYKMAVAPLQSLAGSLTGTLAPVLSHLAREPVRQARAALAATSALGLTLVPVCLVQAALAGPVIDNFFPAKWHVAIPLVQILSIGLALDAPAWTAGALLNARGEFRKLLALSAMTVPAFFALVAGMGHAQPSGHAATGVALGVASFHALVAPVMAWHVFRRAGLGKMEVAMAVYGTFAASIASVALPYGGLWAFGISGTLLPVLAGAIAVPVHCMVTRSFFPNSWDFLASRLRRSKGVAKAVADTGARIRPAS